MGIINAVIPIIILLAIGLVCKKYWLKDASFWSAINKLVYYIMFPCLMVYSIAKADFADVSFSFIPILMAIVILFMAIIWMAKPLFKNERFWVTFLQGSVRYNSYVFIAVTFFYVGSDVMPIIALITAFLVITTNVISVFVLNFYSPHKKSLLGTALSTVTNPLVFSCLLGLAINVIAVQFPMILEVTWLNRTLDYIGKGSLPLSLIAVGASLKMDVFKSNYKGILGCSIIKLVALPVVVVFFLHLAGFNPMLILVCMIYAGSPCSSNATAMTQSMGGDHESMSLIISTQTILSILTLPALLYVYSHIFVNMNI